MYGILPFLRKNGLLLFVLAGVLVAVMTFFTLEKRVVLSELTDQEIAIEHAHEHLEYLNESIAELTKIHEQRRPIEEAHPIMEEALEHDQHIIDAMLAAEASGANLREIGLVELFCDSLEAQFEIIVKINGGINVPELAPEDLTSRVARGVPFEEAAQGVVAAILEDAMKW